ncbi:MAG: hypothetical protein LWW87_09025 [Geobacteraceae bacterium]|nr:hypothetical protein [Geobacteraceae bacterium]
MSTDAVSTLVGNNVTVHFVMTTGEDTPISLRCRAMALIAADYETIIFTDSDDILEPSRVSAALSGLEGSDLYGCALALINDSGEDMGIYFGLDEDEDPYTILPHYNFLGLSNTAWRVESLLPCLPAPEQCVALDWLLATRAWAHGARIKYDRTIRMRYRQHGKNTASVIPPFTSEQIIRATEVVTAHYRFVIVEDSGLSFSQRKLLQQAVMRVGKFRETVLASSDILNDYVTALNNLPPHHLWWLSVAHPALENIWNR